MRMETSLKENYIFYGIILFPLKEFSKSTSAYIPAFHHHRIALPHSLIISKSFPTPPALYIHTNPLKMRFSDDCSRRRFVHPSIPKGKCSTGPMLAHYCLPY